MGGNGNFLSYLELDGISAESQIYNNCSRILYNKGRSVFDFDLDSKTPPPLYEILIQFYFFRAQFV